MKLVEFFSCGKNKKKKQAPKASVKYEVVTTTVTEPRSLVLNPTNSTSSNPVQNPHKASVAASTNRLSKKKTGSFGDHQLEETETHNKDESPSLNLSEVMKAGNKNPEFKQIIQDLKDLDQESRLRVERCLLEKIMNIECNTRYLFDPIWVNCYSNYVTEKTDEPAPELFQPELVEGFILNNYVYSVNIHTWNFLSALYKGGKQTCYLHDDKMKQQLRILTEKQPCLDAQLEATPYLCDKIINSRALGERRALENNYMTKHEEKRTPTAYILNKTWYKLYKKYLEGGPRPSNEVNNDAIESTLKAGTFSEHFCFVNEFVWLFLAKIYEISVEVPVQVLNLDDLPEFVKSFEELLSEELINILDTEIESDAVLMKKLSYTTKRLLELHENIEKDPHLDLSLISEIKIVEEDTDFGEISSSLVD